MSLELLDLARLVKCPVCIPDRVQGSLQRPHGRGKVPVSCKVPKPASLGVEGRAWEDGVRTGYSMLLLL